MDEEKLKAIETELAYLRKSIDNLIEIKPVEIHYHYYYDYDNIKHIINKGLQNYQK